MKHSGCAFDAGVDQLMTPYTSRHAIHYGVFAGALVVDVLESVYAVWSCHELI